MLRISLETRKVQWPPTARGWTYPLCPKPSLGSRIRCLNGRCGQSGTRRRSRAGVSKRSRLKTIRRSLKAWKRSTNTVYHTTRNYMQIGYGLQKGSHTVLSTTGVEDVVQSKPHHKTRFP